MSFLFVFVFLKTLSYNVPHFCFYQTSVQSLLIALNCRSLTNLSFDSLLEAAETLFDANDNCDVFAAEWVMPDMST